MINGRDHAAGDASLRIHLTGYPTVLRGEAPVTGPAAQRHRLALLALLALAPDRTMSRDRIVALLWSESDASSARNLLNVSVHALRRGLGKESLLSRGDSLALSPEVWVDVVEFRRAVGRGALAEAVACIRAQLLDGFHLEHASEFDQWAALQRSALSAEYRDALALLATRSVDLAESSRWWRALVTDDPLNSHAVAQLMLALERQGDYGNAIQLALEHEHRLAEELEARPDPEFAALVQRLREHPAAQMIEWQGPLRPVSHAAGGPPVTDQVVVEPFHPRHRWRGVAMAGVVLLAAGWYAATVTDVPRHPAVRPEVVAVLPFGFRGGADTLSLSLGMAELLATGLEVPGEWRAADPSAVYRALSRLRDTSLTARRTGVARAVGATRVITGELAQAGGTLRMAASIWGPGASDSALASTTQVGPIDSLFPLIDRLTAQLLAFGGRGAPDRLDRLATRTTASLPALRLYLGGTAAYRRGEYARASELLSRAIELDSTFSLAHYRLATSVEWLWQYERARAAAAAALRTGTRLGPSDLLLARALERSLAGAVREAERLYAEAVTQRPEDQEAWYHLADLQFHFYAVRDRPMQDSRRAWDNAIGADSTHAGAMLHRARLAALDDDTTTLRRLLTRMRQVSPAGDRQWELRAYLARRGGGSQGPADFFREVQRAGDSAMLIPLQTMSAFTDDVDAARVFGLALRDSPRPEMRAYALHRLAELEMMAGRPGAADHFLGELSATDADMALVSRAYFATLPGVPASDTVLDSLSRALREHAGLQRRRAAPVGAIQGFATLPPIYPEVRWFLLGRMAAFRGRWGALAEALDSLRALHGPPPARVLARDMARSLEASRALVTGDSARADSLLRALAIETSVDRINSSWFYAQHAEQYERAVLSRWRGDDDRALMTYGAVRHSLLLAAPAALASAELLERHGDMEGARREYARAGRLLTRAEPSRAAWVARARAGAGRVARR